VRKLNRDSLPHMIGCFGRAITRQWSTLWNRLTAYWWGVQLGSRCSFIGHVRFRRHPKSRIAIGASCKFNSSMGSNSVGVNRPCIVTTIKEGAEIEIGLGCGFSGTTIACAKRVILGENVRCGANTFIMDTDWHTDDPRTGPDTPVIIGKNVWLGVNVTVLKGVTIGENTLVGAGSLVASSLPPGVIAIGMPARVVKKIEAGSLETLQTPD